MRLYVILFLLLPIGFGLADNRALNDQLELVVGKPLIAGRLVSRLGQRIEGICGLLSRRPKGIFRGGVGADLLRDRVLAGSIIDDVGEVLQRRCQRRVRDG